MRKQLDSRLNSNQCNSTKVIKHQHLRCRCRCLRRPRRRRRRSRRHRQWLVLE